jgi:hypothetical protein
MTMALVKAGAFLTRKIKQILLLLLLEAADCQHRIKIGPGDTDIFRQELSINLQAFCFLEAHGDGTRLFGSLNWLICIPVKIPRISSAVMAIIDPMSGFTLLCTTLHPEELGRMHSDGEKGVA